MATANCKDAYYTSHDCNARNDPKILPLRAKYGAAGYGIYWMLIEILREQPGYRYPVTDCLYIALAMQMQVDAELLEKVITDCCEKFRDDSGTLLCNDGHYLYSQSLFRRMERLDEIKEKRRQAANNRWENADDASAKQKQSKSKAKI